MYDPKDREAAKGYLSVAEKQMQYLMSEQNGLHPSLNEALALAQCHALLDIGLLLDALIDNQ